MRYPGLSGHPTHAAARRQLAGFGMVISFDVRGTAAAALTGVARTDLDAYLAYLDSVAAYHERVKQQFLPVIFSAATVAEVDWAAAPRHRHRD